MTWGRSATSVATKGGRANGQAKLESRSGRSTPVQDSSTDTFAQPLSSKSARSRSHSFSLPFFHAQRAAAKQEALQRKAAAAAHVAVVTTTMKTSSEIDEQAAEFGKESLPSRFFARTQSSRSAASPDLSSGRPSLNTPRTSSSFKDTRKRQQQVRTDDDEFSCCGLDASIPSTDARLLPLELTSRASSRLDGAQHKNALSVSSVCSTVSSNQSSASMIGDTSGSSGSGASHVASNGGGGVGDDEILMTEMRRTREGEMGNLMTTTQKEFVDPYLSMASELGDIDAMDVADLLDQTLMPIIMSPTVLHKDHSIDSASFDVRLRQARSMPMLRAAKMQQRQQQMIKAPALPSVDASSIILPYSGDTNGLRLQLGPALAQMSSNGPINRPTNVGTSPLRIRRKKAPLTIDANVFHQQAPILPFPPSEDRAQHGEQEQMPLSASSVRTSSTLTEPSPRTPLQALPAVGRPQMPRARRSSSNRTLKSSYALASPPPCPPPATPLPDIPTFEMAVGGQRTHRISCSTETSATTNTTTTTTPSTSFVSAKADSRRQSTMSKCSASSVLITVGATPPPALLTTTTQPTLIESTSEGFKLEDPELAGFGFAF